MLNMAMGMGGNWKTLLPASNKVGQVFEYRTPKGRVTRIQLTH